MAGVAWAQHRGISKVEVQVDDQPWRPATLAPWSNAGHLAAVAVGRGPPPHAPTTWRCEPPTAAGAVQSAQNVAPIPDGASGYHTVLSQVDRLTGVGAADAVDGCRVGMILPTAAEVLSWSDTPRGVDRLTAGLGVSRVTVCPAAPRAEHR